MDITYYSKNVVIVSERGCRPEMEDFHSVDCSVCNGASFLLAGVYDGHGSAGAPRYAQRFVPEHFLSLVGRGMACDWAWRESYKNVSADLCRNPPPFKGGTCAVNFFLHGNILSYANVGDSGLLFFRDGTFERLSEAHNLANETERDRVKRAGGTVSGFDLCCDRSRLKVTRALGDASFQRAGLIAVPAVGARQVRSGDTVLAASDGLFDKVSDAEVRALVAADRRNLDAAAERLRARVFERGASDNLTIILAGVP